MNATKDINTNVMERNWIYLESSPAVCAITYDDYYAEDDSNYIKRVWSDGYIEYYEAA